MITSRPESYVLPLEEVADSKLCPIVANQSTTTANQTNEQAGVSLHYHVTGNVFTLHTTITICHKMQQQRTASVITQTLESAPPITVHADMEPTGRAGGTL